MHDLDLLMTLAGGLGAALILGYISHRLGVSPIVGYLLAGIVVGPSTPGFIANALSKVSALPRSCLTFLHTVSLVVQFP